jgi:hypothetical protein
MSRGVGKGYFSAISTDTGFFIEFMTYNQSPAEFAGHTIGLTIFIEPPPKPIFVESMSRLRKGGIASIEMTPLDQAAYIKFDYLDLGSLKDDKGNVVGEIKQVTGDFHENCMECYPGGQLPHKEIMATIASWPEEEREMRRSGDFGSMAGLIYQNYGENNEWDQMPSYYQDNYERGNFTLYCVMDPHDARPPAIGWFAVFPNQDIVGIAEYPNQAFESMPRPRAHYDEYRSIILDTEKAIGKVATVRLIDPAFGNAPKHNGETIVEMFAGPCRKCITWGGTCSHKLFFNNAPNDIPAGHMRMRMLIGNVKEGLVPKFFNMKHCRNLCTFHRRYGYGMDKSRKLVEKPELEYKDFCDLSRYGANYGFRYLEDNVEALPYVKMKTRGKNYRGI